MRGERGVDCFVYGHCLDNFVAYCHVVFMDVFQNNDMKKTFSKIADVGKQILRTSSSAAASRQGQIRGN